jgi:hypothetical protein
MITQTANDTHQPAQQHRQTKQRAKAQTKAHTEQPVPPTTTGERIFVGIGTVIVWLLVPCMAVLLVIYKVRVARARMGYRTVTIEHKGDSAQDRGADLWR